MAAALTRTYLHGGGLDLIDPDVALAQLVVAAAAVGDDLDTVQGQLNVPADKNTHTHAVDKCKHSDSSMCRLTKTHTHTQAQWTNANTVQRQLNAKNTRKHALRKDLCCSRRRGSSRQKYENNATTQ